MKNIYFTSILCELSADISLLGLVKLILGGMTSPSRVMSALVTATNGEAPSACPKLLFIVPTSNGWSRLSLQRTCSIVLSSMVSKYC